MFKGFNKNMFNFVLSILFWIFAWNLIDLLINELDMTNKHKIIFYIISLTITSIIIYNDKSFFNYV